jgi:probable rRNA maturation factor
MPASSPGAAICLLVRDTVRAQIPPTLRQRLRRQLGRALAASGHGTAQVCLTLSDDDELHALNLQYAGEDHATDVLSFSQLEAALPVGPQPMVPILLGDIVISVPIAARQAAERRHSLHDELLHLAVHGLCHLLGYDHATPRQEQVMFGYEAVLRSEAGARRSVRHCPPPPRTPGRRRTTAAAMSAGR